MNRCEECGSWEAECMADGPVVGCGCARCASAELARCRSELADVLAERDAMQSIATQALREKADVERRWQEALAFWNEQDAKREARAKATAYFEAPSPDVVTVGDLIGLRRME